MATIRLSVLARLFHLAEPFIPFYERKIRDRKKKKMKETNVFNKQKEREGFEPSIVPRTIPVFKTGAINHSAISPQPNPYFTPTNRT